MTRYIALLAFGLSLALVSIAHAAERTVTLVVKNMYCATCPYIVRQTLQAVPGVKNVVVSFSDKTAVVIFDDAKTSLSALTTAVTNAGYPSTPKS